MPPARRVTSEDVARVAGVSRTTVSLVLNDVQGVSISPATRQRVLEAAHALGYVPNATAQALARRRTQAIGLVMTRSPHHIATDSFLPKIIAGLIEVIHAHNLRLLIEWVDEAHQAQTYYELARAKRIDGLILTTPRLNDAALRELEQSGLPTVLMGNVPGSNLCSVDVDNRAAAEKAVRYLIELGHRRIACITNAPLAYTAAPERLQGYLDALRSAAIEVDQDLIRFGDFDPQSGYAQMQSLLALGKRFSAAFIASDNVAIGAKAAIREAGLRVPDDISLMGFDDIPWAQYSDPPLTTVRLPALELAKSAGELLLKIMQGSTQVEKKILDVELVVRKSCSKVEA